MNAAVEKSASPITYVTTSGHRDILFVRHGDSQPFDTRWEPPPIVRRRSRLYSIAPISNNVVLAFGGQHVLGLPRFY